MVKRAKETIADMVAEEEIKEEEGQEEKEDVKPDGAVKDLESMIKESDEDADKKFMEDYRDITIDDLIVNGCISHEANIFEGFVVKIRTLTKKEEISVKRKISEYDGVQIYIMDETNLNTLVYAIEEINGSPLPEKFEEKKEILLKQSDTVMVAISDAFRDLNKALIILIKGSSKNSLAHRLLGRE